MKLLKFPNLVLEEVYGQLSTTGKLVLSMASKKTLDSIKQFKWNMTEVEFIFGQGYIEIGVFSHTSGKIRQFDGDTIAFRTSLSPTICCQPLTSRAMAEFEFYHVFENNVALEMHDHIFELFFRDELRLRVCIYGYQNYSAIPNVYMADLSGESTHMHDIDEFVTSSSKLESLKVFGDLIGGKYPSPNSKMFSVRSLYYAYSKNPFTKYIRYFKGRDAIFSFFHEESSGYVIEFLEKWIIGEYSESLEYVQVRNCVHDDFIRARVVHRFQNQLKPWNGSGMPGFYRFGAELEASFEMKPEHYDFQGGFYLEREADGRRGLLKLGANFMSFWIIRNDVH